MKKTNCPINKILRTLAVLLPVLAMFMLSTPVLAAPLITLSPTSGAIGTKVTITGTNFESYRGDNLFMFFNNEEIASSPLTVPPTGSFSVELIIPAAATPGTHRIEVRSETRSTSWLARTFFIIPETVIQLDTVDGTVGTIVTADGTGFYAGKLVTLYYYNMIKDKLGTAVATATGEFSYRFTIPDSTVGKHKITAENTEDNSAEAKFEVIPSATLNLTSGATGDILTISGTGFGYRSDISIYFRNKEVAYAKSDKYGNFKVTFNVPEIKPGTYDVKTEDEDNNIDKIRFTITAGASLNKTMGPIGTELAVRGSGFKAGGAVIIKYDALQIATATTDNDGAFSTVFNVPPSIGGKHLVTISDGITARQLTFTVEPTAPPVPTPLIPVYNSETKSRTYFDWEDVTDPSLPVTYSLRVASDQNFASIVLEKKGLTDSEYALTDEEKLAAVKKETPYYWRVKAIDSASNESEWSAPWSFYVATPPVPALLLPGIGVEAEREVRFDWQDVTGLSPPITYRLQVASDENFASIVLEKKELADSEYALTDEEKLAAVKKEAPYYWRVKAIDSTPNESEWSAPWSFYVGFSFTMPGWAIYTLIVLSALVVGFLAFWLGRRTAYYESEP